MIIARWQRTGTVDFSVRSQRILGSRKWGQAVFDRDNQSLEEPDKLSGPTLSRETIEDLEAALELPRDKMCRVWQVQIGWPLNLSHGYFFMLARNLFQAPIPASAAFSSIP